MATILEDKPTQAESDEDPEKTHEKDADFGASMGRAIEEHEKAKQRRQQTPAPITPNLSAPVEQEAVETNPFRQALERKKSDIGQWFAQRLTTAVNTEASFEYGQHGDWLGITRDLARLKQARFEIKGEKKRDILDQIKVGMKHYENDPMAFSEILTNLKYLDKDFDVTEYQEKFKKVEEKLIEDYARKNDAERTHLAQKVLQFATQRKYLGLNTEPNAKLDYIIDNEDDNMLDGAGSAYQKALIIARRKYLRPDEFNLSLSEDPARKEIKDKLDEYSQGVSSAEPFAKLYSICNNRHFGGRRELAKEERQWLHQKFEALTQGDETERLVTYTGDLLAAERAAKRVQTEPEELAPTLQETAEVVATPSPPDPSPKEKNQEKVQQQLDADFQKALREIRQAEAAKAEVPTTEPRPEPVSPSTPQPEATAPNLEEKRQQIEALLKQHRDIAAKAPDRKSQQAQVIERLQALLPDKFTGATIAKIVHGKNDTRVWLQVEDRQKRPTIEQLFGWEPSEPKVGKDKTDTSAAPGTSTHATPQAPEKPKGRTDNLADAFDRAIQKQREREEAAKKTTEPELPIPTPKKKEPPAPPAPEPVSNPEPPQAKEPEKTAASPEPEPKKAADAQEPREVVTDVPYLHIPEEDQRKIESLDRDALIEEINQHLDTEKSERPRDTKIDGFYMDLFEDSADLLRKLTSQLNKEKRNKKKIAEFERGIFRQVRRSLPKKPDQDIALLSKERIQWIEKCDALLRRYAELIGEQPQEKGKAA